jgi:hypothetical protein
MRLADGKWLQRKPAMARKALEAPIHNSLSIIVFRTTYGPKYGRFHIRKRSRMGGDARVRRILNNGLEMVRKAVKSAEERHGGGLKEGADAPIAAPRRGPQPLRHVVPARSWRESPLSYLAKRCGAYTSALGGGVGIS